jgi:O-antigen/teichoic acid export membrane protein
MKKAKLGPYDAGVETGVGVGVAAVKAGSPGHMQDLHKVATGSSINFLGSIVRTLANFVYAILLATFLDPASVGLFFLGITLITLLGTTSTLGLDTGLVRYTALYDGIGDRARVRGILAGGFLVAAPIAVLIAVAVFVLAGPIANGVFDKPDLAFALKVFAPYIPLYVIARLFNSGTQGLKQMKAQVYSRDFAEQIIKIALTSGLVVFGISLTQVISINLVSLAVAMVLSLYFLIRMEPVFGHGLRRVYEFRRLLSFSAPLAVSTLLSLLLLWTDTLFLGFFRPSEDVGIYSIAIRIATLGGLVLVSFNAIFAPLASDLYNRRENERLEKLLKTVTKWVSAISFPIFAGLALYAYNVLGLINVDYTIGATAFVILTIGKMFDAVTGPVANMLIMCGRPRIVLLNNIVVFMIDVVLCIVLIPRYGMVGAAIASAATLILFNVGVGSGVIFLLKLQPFSKRFFALMAAGAVAAIIGFAVKQLLPGQLGLVCSIVAFIASYTGLAYLAVFDASDMEVAREFLAKLKEKRTERLG